MNKKMLILLMMIFSLSSCFFWEEEKVKKIEKQKFFVETKKISDFSWNYEIKKIWKIKSSQEIILSSKASWRVSQITKKSGEKIVFGEKIIFLNDTVSNYWLNLEKTNLWIESAKLNYSSTKISLDKQISDSKLALEKIKKEYEITKKSLLETEKSSNLNLEKLVREFSFTKQNLQENKKIASISLENSNILSNEKINSSKLQIKKLQENIKKAELDLENLVLTNSEQIKSFDTTVKKDYLNLANLFNDIIDFSDKILWVTKINKEENDSFQDYLWAKNKAFKNNLEKELLDLINFKNQKFDNLKTNNNLKINILELKNLQNIFILWEEWYKKTITFLNNFEKIFDYSIENVYFSKNTIDWYKAKINSFQTILQQNYASFISFKASSDNFLNTYKSKEESVKRQIIILGAELELLKKNLWIQNENAKINYKKSLISEKNTLNSLENLLKTSDINHKKTLLNSKNTLNNMEIALKNAKLNLSQAIKNKNISLKQLNNQIKISQNTKKLAAKEYSKLFISSPISWVISEILVDIWQEVNVSTPLVKLSSLSKNEVEIWLSFSEIKFIKPWDKVIINYLWEKLEWNISSISAIADKNLNYKAKVSINSSIKISWNMSEVIIPISLKKKLIELKNIKVQSDWIGEINVLSVETFKALSSKALSPESSLPDVEKGAAKKEEKFEVKKVLVKFGKFYWDKVEILWCKDLDEKKCDNLEIIINDVSNFDKEKFDLKRK